MTKIIAVSGRKFSGKSTLCAYIKAHLMAEEYNCEDAGVPMGQGEGPLPRMYPTQGPKGDIQWADEDGQAVDAEWARTLGLDVELADHPANIYSFADALKDICVNVLGLKYEQVWGTEQEKNSLTQFKWENLPTDIRLTNSEAKAKLPPAAQREFAAPGDPPLYAPVARTGLMTARQVMQVFGTDVMRRMFYNDVWVDATIREIQKQQKPYALIADMRFRTEFAAIQKAGGYVIRLERAVYAGDTHASEVDFDGFDFTKHPRTLVIPATNDIHSKNKMALDWLKGEGVL